MRKDICKLFLIQIVVVLMLVFVLGSMSGVLAAVSALMGGFLCILPHALFARWLFKYQGALAARQIVHSFYMGEAIKLWLTALLFTVVWLWIPVSAPSLLVGYIVAQMVLWIAPWLFRYRGGLEVVG